MVSFFKFLLGVTSSFLFSNCTDLQIKENFEGLDNENGTLIIDRRNWNPGILFFQLISMNFLNELTIREFVFDEISIKEFSNSISALSVKKLSIIQCDFNEQIAEFFAIPPSIKAIHLEQLNLSSKGIEIILSKLDPSVESITISACYKNEPKNNLPSFTKFSSLKQIDIDEDSIGMSNIYDLIRYFLTPSLESIRLYRFNFYSSKINSILEECIVKYGKSFANNLKIFELGAFYSDYISTNKLMEQLFSFENLESLSCKFGGEFLHFSIDTFSPKLKRLNLEGSIIDITNNQELIYSQSNISESHAAKNENFHEIPIFLFYVRNLEYLNLRDILCIDITIPEIFQSSSSLKHLIIQAEHLYPFLPNFEKEFKVIETLEMQFKNPRINNCDLKKLFTNSTLKTLKLDFFIVQANNFKSISKCECLLEELELKSVPWEFIYDLLDKFTFSRLKRIIFCCNQGTYDLYDVLYRLQSLTELTSLSLGGDVKWKIEKKAPFMFKNLILFNWKFNGNDVIELDHLILGMPKLQTLYLPTWDNNELFLRQPAINIRYLYLPITGSKLNKTNWINFLKNLPNLVQVRFLSMYKFSIENEITSSDLAYYLKILKEHFKNDLHFEIQPNCLPILFLIQDEHLYKLIRCKSKELNVYLNEIFPLNTFVTHVKQLFIFEFENYFVSHNFYSFMKFFKLLIELDIENEQDILFVKSILLDGEGGRFTETTDFSLPNIYNLFLNYLIDRTKVSLDVEHLEFLIKFFKANKQYGFEKVNKFIQTFFIGIADRNHKFIDKEMLNLFSSYLLAPTFQSFFDKIVSKELSEREKKILPIDFNAVSDDLKKLELKQYEELSFYFKDFLIQFTNESFIESFSNILKKILIPETKCVICYESLFSEECKFSKAGKNDCHLFHKTCLDKWLSIKDKCPHCRQTIC